MSNFNVLVEKKQRRRLKKQALIIFFSALILLSCIIFFTYIKNNPRNLSDLPRINITHEEKLGKNNYADGTFELISNDKSETISPVKSKIKIRGEYNAQFKKKGYRIELAEELSLLGMRKDDDWQLFAMHFDQSFMRTKLSFKLWQSLHPTNPTAISPKSEFVELSLNGEYKGLYLLAEKNDRRLFGLDDAQNDVRSSLIFQSNSKTPSFEINTTWRWEQDWPNEDEGIYIKDEILLDLTYFINKSNEDDFFDPSSGVYSKFDKKNLVDFLIFNFFILHEDFWSKNYFLARNSYPSKFFLIPWDYDGSFGQLGILRSDPDTNPEEEIHLKNKLFARLMDNPKFIKDCNDRWGYLRKSLWTEDFILKKLSEIYGDLKDILSQGTVDGAISSLYEWIPERLLFCDNYFHID